jgi:hypothetical protein
MKISSSLSLVILFIFFSCGDDSSTPASEDPSNLILDVVVADDNSGIVEITAIADNTTEYQFDVGESGVAIISNTTGMLTHTYSATGVYEIEVKAVGSRGKFIREIEEINITVGEDQGPFFGPDGYVTPLSYDGMTLIWQDEFNGSSLDLADWNFETGGDGWGNNELQYYRPENTTVIDGTLIIEAKEESFGGNAFTSSRLTTQNKFSFQYGRVDIRARLPKGQGLWPALWMLGANFSSVGWPFCGEIDIMEIVGGGPGKDDTTHGTIHWDNGGTKADVGGSKTLTSGIFNDSFYVFTIVWDESSITWYLNDEMFFTVDTTPADLSEFQRDFFFIFNVAVGGNWPGSPNSTTEFPQQMVVDYVRVFQDN